MKTLTLCPVIILLAGCATRATSQPVATVARPSVAAQPYVDPDALTAQVVRCWSGGVWGDAAGVPSDERRAATVAVCTDVVRAIYGAADYTRLEQLRAFEANTVDDLLAGLGRAKHGTPGVAERLAFVRALAAAEREGMWARRAADRIKVDLEEERASTKLTADEVAAARALRQLEALRGLFSLRAGRYTPDAHALGVLLATDRMQLARGLPKHMKMFAVDGVYAMAFGALAPLPLDATSPAQPGAWLACLLEGARAAGHPVPTPIRDVKEQNRVAWAGILDGFADLLRADVTVVTPQLRPLVEGTVRRLRAEATGTRDYVTSLVE